MKKAPLVSIVIPAYNSSAYILRTVKAALDQDYKNVEVLVVDDCSTDDTVKVLETVTDPRFRLIQNTKNLGMTGNWNACVRAARGEYVKLIPADDIVYAKAITSTLPALLKDERVKLSVCGSDLINEEDHVIGQYPHWPVKGVFPGKRIAKTSELVTNFFGNPVCALFRKADFEALGGFDDRFPYILDFDLWLGLATIKGARVAFCKEKASAFRVRTGSNSGQLMGHDKKAYNREHRLLFEKYRDNGRIPMSRLTLALAMFMRWLRNYPFAWFIALAK